MTHNTHEFLVENVQYPSDITHSTGWDLHCHTVFSDGTYSPTQLIFQAKNKGLAGVAITDHDTIAGWQEAKRASIAHNFPVIRGTEITTQWSDNISVHVLAYLYDCDDYDVLELYAHMRARRLARAQRMVENLSHDFPITWQSVLDQVKEGDSTTIGRPHIADALVSAGVYATRSEAFAGVISSSSKYYIPVTSPSTADAIRTLKNAGGIVVLAHCGAISRNRKLLTDKDIEFFIRNCGLDGLEVYHRDNSSYQQKRLTALAHRYDLLITGGSDWHGKGKPNLLGENLTDSLTVDRIIERGKIRVLP